MRFLCMTSCLEFTVTGHPIAQPRYAGGGKRRWIRPRQGEKVHPIHGWKQAIILAAQGAMRTSAWIAMCEAPIRAVVHFEIPRPATHWLKSGSVRAGAPQGIWHTCTPDADNLVKAVWDACRRAGVYRDDCQIYDWQGQKRWTLGPDDPGRCWVLFKTEE